MSRADVHPDPVLTGYLARLGTALRGLPMGDREEILLETRSHVLEQLGRAPNRRVADVLAELGAPEEYARQFVGDAGWVPAPIPESAPPTGAHGNRPGSATLFGLAQLTTRGGRAAPWLLLFGALYVVAGIALLFVIGDLLAPAGTGVFVQPASTAKPRIWVVIAESGAPGKDVLGRAIVPIGLLLAATIHLGARAMLRRILRQDARPAPGSSTADAPPSSIASSVTLLGLAGLGAGGWRRVPMLLLVLTGYGIAGWGMLLLICELVDPRGTGFVIRQLPGGMRHIGFAVSGTLAPGDDVLGVWFAPLLLLLIAAIHLGIRVLLRRELRRDRPHLDAPQP